MIARNTTEAPTIHRATYYERMRHQDAHISDAEMEKLCESAHCDDCEHYDPCTCESEGVCDAVIAYLTYYDRDMHVIKIPKKPREWVSADDPACVKFEPTFTTLKEWGER